MASGYLPTPPINSLGTSKGTTKAAWGATNGIGSGHERLTESKDLRVVPAPLEKMRAAVEKRDLPKKDTPKPHSQLSGSEVLRQTSVDTVKDKASESPSEEWVRLVELMRQQDALFAAKVENLLFVKMSPDEKMIYLAVPPRMIFLEKQMADPQVRKRLQGFIDSFWGSGYSFQVAGTRSVESGESAVSLTHKKHLQLEEDLRSQVRQNPVVQKASEIFKGEIKAILPLEEK